MTTTKSPPARCGCCGAKVEFEGSELGISEGRCVATFTCKCRNALRCYWCQRCQEHHACGNVFFSLGTI
jgi:hypothetical protein